MTPGADADSASTRAPGDRPHIVVVFTDQQRHDTCGVYGQPLPVTPYLDQVAADGVVFEQAFTVQPLCGPARASVQTGRYPTRSRTFRNDLALPVGTATLATRVGALGYETSYIGKWHLASTSGRVDGWDPGPREMYRDRAIPPERRGGYRDRWLAADALEHTSFPYGGHVFDEQGRRVDFDGYRVDAVADMAIDHLRTRDTDRPLLLFLSFLEPHHQNNRLRYVGPKGRRRRFRDFEPPGDLVGTLGDWRWSWPDYLACCNSIDDNLGRIVDTLATTGMLDDTVLVFTSDHGSHFRTRNAEYKRSCHEASIRVPLVVRGPGFRGGRRVGGLAALVDLVPTLVTAAGGEVAGDETDGFALQAAVAGGAVARDDLLVQISESEVGRALRTTDWKLGVRAPRRNGRRVPASDTYAVTHLYDLQADPHERHNLAHDAGHAEVCGTLADRLAALIGDVEGTEPTIASHTRSVPSRPNPSGS